MADLVAIAYADEQAARRARDNLAEGVEKGLVRVEDVVFIAYGEDGRIAPTMAAYQEGFSDMSGAALGGLIALILVGPLLGIAVGGALGVRASNKVVAEGTVPTSFIHDVCESLTPGSVAMILLLRETPTEVALQHIHEPGRVIRTSLGDEVEARLDAVLAAAKRGS